MSILRKNIDHYIRYMKAINQSDFAIEKIKNAAACWRMSPRPPPPGPPPAADYLTKDIAKAAATARGSNSPFGRAGAENLTQHAAKASARGATAHSLSQAPHHHCRDDREHLL
jgi:hypothetical protein